MTKTPGQIAYEADLLIQPTYCGGKPRPSWKTLGDSPRESWERMAAQRPDRGHPARLCALVAELSAARERAEAEAAYARQRINDVLLMLPDDKRAHPVAWDARQALLPVLASDGSAALAVIRAARAFTHADGLNARLDRLSELQAAVAAYDKGEAE